MSHDPATADSTAGLYADLSADLRADPRAYSFIAAIDLATAGIALGGTAASAEKVRLRPHLSLAFPTSEVVAADMDPVTDRLVLTVGLPGLYGANSPLPVSYTEDLLARDDHDPTRGVLDVIHHRLLSLLHASLVKYRNGDVAIPLQRLTGIYQRLIAGRIPGSRLMAYAGILAGRARGADTLERVVSHYLGVPCHIEQCIMLWTSLPSDQLTRLGAANSGLGVDCIAGDTVCSRATAFRLTLGPVDCADIDGFMPGGEHLADVHALVSLLNADALDYEVELLVDTSQAPDLPLGNARLGYDLRTTGTAPILRRDLVYRSG